jgi:phage recombination protein Bet
MANEVSIKYVAEDGSEMNLSLATVQKYLVGDDVKVTDQEFMLFGALCKAKKLNPFLKEAYLIKYGSKPAQMVVSKDVIFKRAEKNPNYDGIESGVIVETNGTAERLEGTFTPSKSILVGAWATVYRKDQNHPKTSTVNLKDYNKHINLWQSMPAVMIEKIAKVNALREAFPNDFSQMYDEDEIVEATAPAATAAPVKPATVTNENKVVMDAETGEVIETPAPAADAKPAEPLATPKQLEVIGKKLPANKRDSMLSHYNVTDAKNLTAVQASEIIKALNDAEKKAKARAAAEKANAEAAPVEPKAEPAKAQA